MSKEVKIQLAREFRKNPTKSEEIMWGVLRNRQFLNFKFRRQFLIDGYLVDFFCHELRLAIEIDGEMAGGFYINFIEKGHKCSIGYWLGRKFWGKGLMSKVVKAGTDYAFKKYMLKRIEAQVFPYNPASMGVLVNNGFVCEGIFRKGFKKGRCYLDAHVYAKIK